MQDVVSMTRWSAKGAPPLYHVERFKTYSNWPRKIESDVAECENWSIQEYDQYDSAMGGNRGSQGIKYERGQTS